MKLDKCSAFGGELESDLLPRNWTDHKGKFSLYPWSSFVGGRQNFGAEGRRINSECDRHGTLSWRCAAEL